MAKGYRQLASPFARQPMSVASSSDSQSRKRARTSDPPDTLRAELIEYATDMCDPDKTELERLHATSCLQREILLDPEHPNEFAISLFQNNAHRLSDEQIYDFVEGVGNMVRGSTDVRVQRALRASAAKFELERHLHGPEAMERKVSPFVEIFKSIADLPPFYRNKVLGYMAAHAFSDGHSCAFSALQRVEHLLKKEDLELLMNIALSTTTTGTCLTWAKVPKKPGPILRILGRAAMRLTNTAEALKGFAVCGEDLPLIKDPNPFLLALAAKYTELARTK